MLKAAVFLVVLAAASPASARFPVKLDGLSDSFPLGPYLEILEDPDQRYSFGDVSTPPLSRAFQPARARVPNLGASNAAFWVRFTLQNEAPRTRQWILVYELTIVERIDLYLPTGPGTYEHQFAGLSFPLRGQWLADPGYAFTVDIEPGELRTVYMRFEDRTPLLLGLTLWEPAAYAEHSSKVRVMMAFALGVISVLVLYNLGLFFSMRDPAYAWYLLFLVSFGLYQMTHLGWLTPILWPDTPRLALRAPLYLAGLSQVFGLLFARSFLLTQVYAPRLDRFILGLAAVSLIASHRVFIESLPAAEVTNLTGIAAFVTALVAPVLCLVRGYRPARYFLLAWSFFLAGGIVFVLSAGGFLPFSLFVRFFPFMGFCMGGILFSIFLGVRLHSLQTEVLQESHKRRHAEDTVRESEQKYRELVENINEVIFATDAKGTITYVSPAAEKVSGYTVSEILGRNVSMFMSEEDIPQLLAEGARLLEPDRTPKDYRVVTRTGEVHWVRVFIRPFLQDGRLAGMRGVLTDITDRKRSEEELRRHRDRLEELVAERTAELKTANENLVREIEQRQRMQEELLKAQKLESLGTLAGGIAHDFNNILAAILTNISIAKHYGNVAPDIYETLTDAEKALLQAKNLTQQLLGFARGGKPVKKTLALQQLVRDTAEFSLSGSSVHCDYALPEDLWTVDADEGQIAQVIQNLVINADQAMPGGGTIRVSAENVEIRREDPLPIPPGRYVRITVEDKGVGIPEKNLRYIFDPFFTTKQRGSGIGLTTSFTIVNNHDGFIRAESEPGVGTCFHVYLPASEDKAAADPELSGIPVSGGERLLLVDDEAVIRKSAGEVLKRLGYQVDFARDGNEAVASYRRAREEGQPYDLVIMDLTIRGGMGGREAVVHLKEVDPDVKVVVSSGYSGDPVMSEYRAYGFCAVVPKPYRIEDLARTIRDALKDKGC